MKLKDLLYLLFIFFFIILNQFFFIKFDSLFQYIINPLIWLLFSVIGYLLYRNINRYYPNKRLILNITIISALLYNILFYTLGYFVNYANNAYSTSLNGIIINLFSISIVIILKNYIRAILINKYKNNSFVYLIVITLLIYLSNLNLSLIIGLLQDINNIPLVLIKYLIPLLATEIFTSYISYYGGTINTIIYQVILFTPMLLIPVVPKYNDIILLLYNVLFSIFTFIVIKNNLRKKDSTLELSIEKPPKLILYFIIIILAVMFSLGTFPIKPSVVLSSSMYPDIKKGDIIIVKACDINDITQGDIIEYTFEDYHVLHRVTKILNNDNSIELVTKGDNNTKEDKFPITKDNLVGCYLLKIKYLGYPSYLIYNLINNEEVSVETGR